MACSKHLKYKILILLLVFSNPLDDILKLAKSVLLVDYSFSINDIMYVKLLASAWYTGVQYMLITPNIDLHTWWLRW